MGSSLASIFYKTLPYSLIANASPSSEKIVHLSAGMHCFDPFDELPPVGQTPAITNGFVTFGSCNNFPKTNDAVLAAWAEILQRVKNSRLIIKSRGAPDSFLKEKLAGFFETRGVSAERLILLEHGTSRQDHLAVYNDIDIHLDSFPYNGVTTTCDALWMGVPVVTLRGSCHRGRVGASLLTRACEKNSIAENIAEYVELAVDLARDLPRLESERTTRRPRILASPIANGHAYAKSVEAALLEAFSSELP